MIMDSYVDQSAYRDEAITQDEVLAESITKPTPTTKVNPDCQRCRECGEPAIKNMQLQWVIYDYDPVKDDYSTVFDVSGDPVDNVHLCAGCYEKLEDGKLLL